MPSMMQGVVVGMMSLLAGGGRVSNVGWPAGSRAVPVMSSARSTILTMALAAWAMVASCPAAGAMDDDDIAALVNRAADRLVAMEEADHPGEWPYEGVYRVRGEIPIGYRVGGTAIACMAISSAPAFAERPVWREAVDRGVSFLVDATSDPLMSADDYRGGYDVRLWGYIYAALALMDLDARGCIDPEVQPAAREAIAFYLRGIESLEIPRVGGWNYARRGDRDAPSPPSSFMTAAALQTLFRAGAAGHEVDDAVVDRGLAMLERARRATS